MQKLGCGLQARSAHGPAPLSRPAPCPLRPHQRFGLRRSDGRSSPPPTGPLAQPLLAPKPDRADSQTCCTSSAAPSSGAWHGGSHNIQNLVAIVNAIPYQRIGIWAIVAFFAWQLSDFFGIIMGTFVTAFIGNSFVQSAMSHPYMKKLSYSPQTQRRALVVSYFLTIVALVTLFGVMTIPDIAREAADFINRLQSDNIWVVLVEKARRGLGDHIMESLERLMDLAAHNDLNAAATPRPEHWSSERSVALGLTVSSMLKGYTTTAAKVTASVLSSVSRFALQVAVALILSFMFVWDMPAINAGITSLRASRLSPFYNEVAPVLTVFGKLFGKALEAQARIALVNTALTGIGMWLLAIPGIGLLSLFVFLCSFIPIAGCIISTIPIGFVALTEYGFLKLALVILMVTGVHFVEAYLLNPAIYSAHLKLHPLMVLSVLVIAEHSLGIWGLLLAVPLTVFALDYIIRWPDSTVTEVGEREMQKIMVTRSQEDDEGEAPPGLMAAGGAGGGGGGALGGGVAGGGSASPSAASS